MTGVLTVVSPAGAVPALDVVAVRLAAEYPEVSPGSVLRCMLRAAHGLRMAGVTHERMPDEAERVTRRLLERRVGRV